MRLSLLCVQVTGGGSCRVRITIKDQAWVRVEAVAVVPYTTNTLHTLIDENAIKSGNALPVGHRRRLQGKGQPHWHTAESG
jgi:hypothetical protein